MKRERRSDLRDDPDEVRLGSYIISLEPVCRHRIMPGSHRRQVIRGVDCVVRREGEPAVVRLGVLPSRAAAIDAALEWIQQQVATLPVEIEALQARLADAVAASRLRKVQPRGARPPARRRGARDR